eukprot:TRINITY_DN3415_c0_g1_i1.p1 TRINITY_DN3415_c0_g1~~TRINITY_DN3415_c0_g1_i1.p1  ORF type:complete len:696 (+),score=241.89 TRINITY_DN3415_c0_g1_i1:48-2135(+)
MALSTNKQEILLRIGILVLIYAIAFFTRLFSVLRYESVIHEFDPYFNYRSTKYLVEEGFYSFINWFDSTAWYPLGRIVGGTIYPGLMVTAAAVYWVLHFFNFTVQIRNVCVLLAPWFASNTAIATYLFTKEAYNTSSGLVAAAFVAIVPGYISRSVAGSFDNEGVAIFALMITYYFWIKAVNKGSMFYATICALCYFYMVSAWGGYVFIINLIPIHVLILIFSGRFSTKLYVAYCTFYVMGTLYSMQISFVGFQPVQSAEHIGAMGTFGLLQLFFGISWIRSLIKKSHYEFVLKLAGFLTIAGLGAIIVAGTITGYFSNFTGRFYSLLDPTYAKEHIPIIASVSEHQPTTWASFFFDLHFLVFLFPAGLYFCFSNLTEGNIFLILYSVTSVYFAGVMVRLILVLAPIACVMGAIGISTTLKTYMKHLKEPTIEEQVSSPNATKKKNPVQKEVAICIVCGLTAFMILYSFHCTWVTSEAYSSPSIVLAARQPDGSKMIFDDFREAYYWLRMNTKEDARILSWWDYGYQLAAMANRTILVDNNTWNNSHIAQVGKVLASNEKDAYAIMTRLDVDYVLVIFGGLIGYSSDDINKFLWMVRIAGSTDTSIREEKFFTADGEYSMGRGVSNDMMNSVMYKTSYYRFGELMVDHDRPRGFDRVRGIEIGYKDFELEYMEEAFTSINWLVRIYKVKEPNNRS